MQLARRAAVYGTMVVAGTWEGRAQMCEIECAAVCGNNHINSFGPLCLETIDFRTDVAGGKKGLRLVAFLRFAGWRNSGLISASITAVVVPRPKLSRGCPWFYF